VIGFRVDKWNLSYREDRHWIINFRFMILRILFQTQRRRVRRGNAKFLYLRSQYILCNLCVFIF
jgi:hypothetical protein